MSNGSKIQKSAMVFTFSKPATSHNKVTLFAYKNKGNKAQKCTKPKWFIKINKQYKSCQQMDGFAMKQGYNGQFFKCLCQNIIIIMNNTT